MAVNVWLVRHTRLNGGRLGAVAVSPDLAADLIKKGDALPFDRNLRRALAAHKAGADPAPKRRGRPPKSAAPDAPADPLEQADEGEPALALEQADEAPAALEQADEAPAPRKRGK